MLLIKAPVFTFQMVMQPSEAAATWSPLGRPHNVDIVSEISAQQNAVFLPVEGCQISREPLGKMAMDVLVGENARCHAAEFDTNVRAFCTYIKMIEQYRFQMHRILPFHWRKMPVLWA